MNRWVRLLLVAVVAVTVAAACGGDGGEDGGPSVGDAPWLVVTTVSPLRNIVENVGGDRIRVVGLVPEGTNSHTFEPPPSAVRTLAAADLILLNGLHLELPTLEMAQANAREGVEIVLLGDHAIPPDQYVYDFSFPREERNPNPHLWTAPPLAIRYAEITRDALKRLDPPAAAYYDANTERFRTRVQALDQAFFIAAATIPEQNRKLLTYHDSFPFFGPRYGFAIIGAIQPSDFGEPSPQEVARLIQQIREAGVPAIFGSEVFPSEVLDQIAREAGAVQVDTLRDDDLPGEPGDAHNTYVAMMVADMVAIATALGGDAGALAEFDVTDTWMAYREFNPN